MNYLSRREHSVGELHRKLSTRGYPPDDITRVIDDLRDQGLQSDERYTESYVYSRIQKGYGPVRIKQELLERNVDQELINEYINSSDQKWLIRVIQVKEKRFGRESTLDFKEIARQSRFLKYRGFTHDQIKYALRQDY